MRYSATTDSRRRTERMTLRMKSIRLETGFRCLPFGYGSLKIQIATTNKSNIQKYNNIVVDQGIKSRTPYLTAI